MPRILRLAFVAVPTVSRSTYFLIFFRMGPLDLPTVESPISLGMSGTKEVLMQLHIQNMTCGGCARGVTKAVESVDPQAQVKVDLQKRNIDFASSQPASAFVAALSAAGYTAVASA